MAVVSRSHITFRWKHVIQYVTTVVMSVRKIAIPTPYYLLSSYVSLNTGFLLTTVTDYVLMSF